MKTAAKKQFRFDQRLKLGLDNEERARKAFSDSGLKTYPTGLGTLPQPARLTLIRLDDITSLLLRFAPDFICPIPGKFTILVECKSSKGNTPYYSYNLDSYRTGLKLADLGARILCVFDGIRAEWIQDLPIHKVFDDQERLRSVNGSQKSFVLIPKKKLKSLKDVLRKLLNTENQIQPDGRPE